jgi:glycosyltransferase involved in cell wall biosynthesis
VEFIYHHRTAGRGGEGLHVLSMVRALEAAGHPVTLVSPPGVDPRQTAGAVPLDKGAKETPGLQRIWKWVSCHCPQALFEMAELAYNLCALFRLLPEFRRKPAAVFYERYAFYLFMGVFVARFFKRPVILEVNEVPGLQRARGQVMVRLARWLERRIFQRADRILTVSSFLQQEVYRRGARPGSVVLMPNAIDPARFEVNGAGSVVRHRQGLNGATVVGFVGWFDRWDRLDLLVEVARDLRAAHPELQFMLVGDGPAAGALKDKVGQDGLQDVVVLTGPVAREKMPDYIGAMDMCVLPDSNPFGSPMVLFEFMAMGKAVIAPNLPPIRDVLRHGQTGLIIERGDPAALRAAISMLAADRRLRARLGSEARRQVLARHTWEANARRVVELTAEIIQSKSEGKP